MKTQTIRSLMVTSFTLAVAATQLTACTNEEVAMGVGAAAIVGGAAAIAAASSGSSHCNGGYRTVCTDYRNYRGYRHQDCRNTYDSCMTRTYGLTATTAAAAAAPAASDADAELTAQFLAGSDLMASAPTAADATAAAAAEPDVNSVDFAATFGMGFDAADKLVASMKAAKTGDIQALKSLGLADEDLALMAQGQMPSDAGIDNVARSIDMEKANVQAMITRLAQASNVQAATTR